MTPAIISADSHLDLGWLPADTFTSRVPGPLRERAPRVVETDGGPTWVADGVVLSGVAGVGSRGRPYRPGRWQRADRMAATGLYSDGLFRPANPDERWRDQERDGVAGEVLYGLFGVSAAIRDDELAAAIDVAFNDWLVEFCAHDPRRYVGLACLPAHDARAAAQEISRTADMGLAGGVLDVKNGYRPLWHPDWDPVWAAAEECDYPISFHSSAKRVEGDGVQVMGTMAAPEGEAMVEAAIGMSLLQFHGSADYFAIIFGGALDRFASLKIVLGESGIGWIPSMLDRMDWQYDNEFRDLGLKLKPSEYWHRQMYATFQSDLVGMHLIDFLGDGHVMYASDYPHPDGTWPDSRTFVDQQMAHLSDATRQKILHDNAASLYRITSP